MTFYDSNIYGAKGETYFLSIDYNDGEMIKAALS